MFLRIQYRAPGPRRTPAPPPQWGSKDDEMRSLETMSKALDTLSEVVLDPVPTGERGRRATVLATRCLRQTLLAMAEALEPADFDKKIEGIRYTIAKRAWKVISTIGPMVMETLPED